MTFSLLAKNGCCGTKLKNTCFTIGIVFFGIYLYGLLIAISRDFFSAFWIYALIIGIVFTTASICLILAAILENKYLCIPWFIGFIVLIVDCIFWIVEVARFINSENYTKNELIQVIIFEVYDLILFFVNLVLLRYVISYYKELGGSFAE